MTGTLPSEILKGITLNGNTWRIDCTESTEHEATPSYRHSVWNCRDTLRCIETGKKITMSRKKLIEKLRNYGY